MSKFLNKLRASNGARFEYLLSIDMGVRERNQNLGWAYFVMGELCRAGLGNDYKFLRKLDLVVAEVPRWYPYKNKGDVNDLIDLAVGVGEVKGLFEDRGVIVDLVYPRTWKGTVPKEIHNERVLEALSEKEKKLLPKKPRARKYDHNALDAAGIGLWKLGRM